MYDGRGYASSYRVLVRFNSPLCNCNCNCNYDDLYSVVGSKLLLERFTKLSTVSVNVSARG